MMLRRWILCLVLACASAPATVGHKDNDVWFVHATDPHLFVWPDKNNDALKKRHEELNQKALADLLARVGSLPETRGEVSFILLTGDLGVDPCLITPEEKEQGEEKPEPKKEEATKEEAKNETQNRPKQRKTEKKTAAPKKDERKNQDPPAPENDCLEKRDKTARGKQVDRVAELLGASPVQDIYLVAGNNDIAHEKAAEPALNYFNEFIDDVQKKIAANKSSVRLHNLTQCYSSSAGGDAGCYADIADTPYRLVGFPSYSFKNREEENSYDTNTGLQEKQMEKFAGLLTEARQAGKKALIVTHTPEIDDPYTLAQDRYAGKEPDLKKGNAKRPRWSTWNVSDPVLSSWKDALTSDTVEAVFAGHLHDSHKEIYRQPYSWSTSSEYHPDFRKLFLAPPLAVTLQDNSPIQARGFSLVHLSPERVEYQLYWYNQETESFSRDFGEGRHRPKRWRISSAVAWLWGLAASEGSLERLTILLIALLVAFLTVVQVWQIPPPEDPLSEEGAKGQQADPKTAGFQPSPFASNFGKTVIAGLGGLAATAILDALANKPSPDDKELFIVWFTIFFFLLLGGLAAFRAIVEAIRARVAIVLYPPPPPVHTVPPQGPWHRFSDWLDRSTRRFSQWFGSLRVPLLTLFDTFLNLIQGKNQTRTAAFERTIIAQQRNRVRAAETIRKQLNDLIQRKMPADVVHHSVRVNISVLSSDGSVFYIARAPGSASLKFTKRSVAWVSVVSGQIRWYKKVYDALNSVVLFVNDHDQIPGEIKALLLKDYYQWRDSDYEAFVMFPVPWPRRELVGDYVKGAIHVSFKRQADFELLWPGGQIDPAGNPPTYTGPDEMLQTRCADLEVGATLRNSVAILGEVLRGFNEIIYKNYIEPKQLD